MSPRMLGLPVAVLVLAVACSDGSLVSPEPVPANIRMAADSVSVRMGQTAGLATTVLDANGQTIDGARVRYTSTRPQVAAVDSVTGMITPVAVGTAEIEVAAQPVRAIVRVVVVPAHGGEVSLLRLNSDGGSSVLLETGSLAPQAIRFRAMNAAGESLCGVVPLVLTSDPALFEARAARSGDPCLITLLPKAEGAGWLRAEVGSKRDSVMTYVHRTRYHWTFDLPRGNVAAGSTVQPQFVVWGEDGKPAQGVSVEFTYAGRGFLTRVTVVTGPDGTARATWNLPESTTRRGQGSSGPFDGDTTLTYFFTAAVSLGNVRYKEDSYVLLQPGPPDHIEVLAYWTHVHRRCDTYMCLGEDSIGYAKLAGDSPVLRSSSTYSATYGENPFCNDPPSWTYPPPNCRILYHSELVEHLERLAAVVVDRYSNPTGTVPTLVPNGSDAAVTEVRRFVGGATSTSGTTSPCCTWFHSVGGRVLVTNLTKAFQPATVTFTSPGVPSRTVTASGTMN